MKWVQVFLNIKRIISVVKRVEFISDRMPYIMLRARWLHIIVLNVNAPTEELEPLHHMKILLGDFNAKVGRADIFKTLVY
jgi:preprotein translocase subunit SecB